MSKSKKTEIVDVLKNHEVDFSGKHYTCQDIATMAVNIQNKSEDLDTEKDSFGQIFILLAKTCKSVEMFLTVMGTIEARNSWKSKQNPEGTDKAPAVWVQTKSNMKTAWEKFGITPKQVKTTAELNEKLNTARKEAKQASEDAENSKETNNAIVEANQIDKSFSNLLVKMVSLYDRLDDDGRLDMFEALSTVYNQFSEEAGEAAEDEIAALLGDLPEEVEVHQASH